MVDVIFGTDRFQVQETIKNIQKEVRGQHGNFETLVFSTSSQNFDLNNVVEALMTVSLFGDRKFVVLLIENEKDLAKLDEAVLLDLVSYDNFDTNLVIWFCKKPLAKTKIKKAIDINARVHELKALDDAEFLRRLTQYAQSKGVSMERDAMLEFSKRLNKDLLRSQKEFEKFEVLGRSITRRDVVSLVNESFDDAQFALSNALMDRNVKQAFAVYHRLIEQKIDPLALLGMIGSSLRGVYQVMALVGEGYHLSKIVEVSTMSSGQVRYIMSTQKRNPKEVLALLNDLGRLDQDAKLGKIDRFLAFEMFMISLAK